MALMPIFVEKISLFLTMTSPLMEIALLFPAGTKPSPVAFFPTLDPLQ
jgi:hypothetical protein